MADSLKEKVSKEIDARRGRLIEVSMAIHGEPELGHQEFKASALLASELEGLGFEVERGHRGSLPRSRQSIEVRGRARRSRSSWSTMLSPS